MTDLPETFAEDWSRAARETRLRRKQIQTFAHDRGDHYRHEVVDFGRSETLWREDAPRKDYARAVGCAAEVVELVQTLIILDRYHAITLERRSYDGEKED